MTLAILLAVGVFVLSWQSAFSDRQGWVVTHYSLGLLAVVWMVTW